MLPISAIPPTSIGYSVPSRMEPALAPGSGVQPLALPEALPGTAPAQAPQSSFASLLGRMVEEVSAKQNVAADAVTALQSGQNVSLHQAVIAMEEASVSFQLMVEVRNKLLDSYQELMRMQI